MSDNRPLRMLVLDIETAPTNDPQVIDRMRENLKPPGNYKKQESIDEWYRTQGTAALVEQAAKTALNGMAGRVIAVGFTAIDFVYQHGTSLVSSDATPTRTVIREPDQGLASFLLHAFGDEMYDLATKPEDGLMWVAGHNLVAFDLPFLWQQHVRANVSWPEFLPVLPSPYDSRVLDTMTGLVGARNTVSLEDAARACGILWRDTIPSADVPAAWEAGDYEAVAAHLKNDVDATALLAARIIEVRP